MEQSEPLLTLIGHEASVCSLSRTSDGCVISGSYDKTARVWKGSECIFILSGHSHNVWAVLGLSTGEILTGSADHTIKKWVNGKCTHTWKRHTDCVRGLCEMQGIGFASTGNDCNIFVWSYNGDLLQHMMGHTSFIYSISVIPGSHEIVTGSEDRTLKVWRNEECIDTIMHRGSVWCVDTLPNGDIVTGCSDGIARIWTRDSSRFASEQVLKSYEEQIASQTLPKDANLGNLKMEDETVLQFPGKKDQEIKVIRKGNQAEAYQWSEAETRWIKIGEVIDANSSGKQQYLGKEYDYLFDVDIGDGQMRKLPHNNGDNPYVSAQEFLMREELSNDFLDIVAQFIIKNTQNFVIGQTGPTYTDPYTGGSRYVPQSMESVPVTTSPEYSHLPQKSPLFFDSLNTDVILKKILDWNQQETSIKDSPLVLSSQDISNLKSFVKTLSETSRYHVSTFSELELGVLFKKLLLWPSQFRFSVLDLFRIMALHPEGSKLLVSNYSLISKQVFANDSTSSSHLLLLRMLCNLFRWEGLRQSLIELRETILDRVSDFITSDNKNVRLSLATLLINYAVLFLQQPPSTIIQEGKLQCISLVNEMLQETDEETLYRSLVALGTSIWNDSECTKLMKDLTISPKLQTLSTSSKSSKIQQVATEIKKLEAAQL